MVAEARETERIGVVGAVNAEADSSRARATMAADCMIDLRTKGKAVSAWIGRGGRAGGRCVAAGLVQCAHAESCALCRRGVGG